MPNSENVTTKFRVDISDLKRNITEANRQLKLYRAELKNASAGMEKGEETVDSLTRKIEAQGRIVQQEERKLQALKDELRKYESALQSGEDIITALTRKHREAADAYGEDSEEARKLAKQLDEARAAQDRNASAADNLRVKIVSQDTAVKNAQLQIEKFENTLNDMQGAEDDATDSTEKLDTQIEKVDSSASEASSGGIQAFSVAVGNLVSHVIEKAIEKIAELGKKMTELVTDAVGSYADYEQLVGGVETLFGASSDRLLSYAEGAYRTAGLSANDYLETAASFSASLIQGLEGDTEAAVRLTDLAITDMADNVNKFGGDISSVQNAYQGFAKQNYTMLDNLKLGYGGTKEEMLRLINDSGILSETIKDLDNVTFGQMIEAIHAIQEQLGVAGATAEEAGSTISGSWGAVQALFQNISTKIGSKFAPVVMDFLTKLSTWADSVDWDRVADKLGALIDPIIDWLTQIDLAKFFEGALDGALSFINLLGRGSGLMSRIGALFRRLEPYLEDIGAFLADAWEQLAPIFQELGSTILDTVFSLLGSILPLLAQLAQSVLPVIVRLIQTILPAVTRIINAVLPVLIQLIETLLPPILKIVDAILPTAVSLLETIMPVITRLIESVLPVVTTLLSAISPILELIADILSPIITLISDTLQPILDVLCTVLEAVNGILVSILEDALEEMKPVIEAVAAVISDLFAKAFEDMQPKLEAFQLIMETISDWLSEHVTQAFEDAKASAETAFSKVAEVAEDTTDKVSEFFQPVLDFIAEVETTLREKVQPVLDELKEWITGVYDKIIEFKDNLTASFSPWFEWIRQASGQVWNVIRGIAIVSVPFFRKIFGDIKAVFAPVISWVQSTFGGAWEEVKKIFSVVGTFFEGLFNDVKEKFAPIGTVLSDAIGGAFKSGMNAVLATAESFLNKIPETVNGLIDVLNALPGVSISAMPQISLPRLAQGGIVSGATTAIVGESGREAIIPLERNKSGLRMIAQLLAQEIPAIPEGSAVPGHGDTVYNFTQTNNSPKALSRFEIYRQTKNLILAAKGV